MKFKILLSLVVLLLIPLALSVGWKITISNPNAYDLTDYQVRIDLSNYTNASYFKVVDLNGNLLNFCYEQPNGECNTTISSIIWVKVPLIPANGNTTIYVWVSNTSYATLGDNVFDFYDDFNDEVIDTNKWVIDGGTYSESGGLICLQTSAASGVSQIYTANTFSEPIIVEVRGRIGTSESGNYILITSDLNYGTADAYVSMGHAPASYGNSIVYKTFGDTATASSLTNDGNFHIARIDWTRNYKSRHFFDNTLIQSETDSVQNTGPMYVAIVETWVTSTSFTYHCADWIRIRKYADQEPTITIETIRFGVSITNKRDKEWISKVNVTVNITNAYNTTINTTLWYYLNNTLKASKDIIINATSSITDSYVFEILKEGTYNITTIVYDPQANQNISDSFIFTLDLYDERASYSGKLVERWVDLDDYSFFDDAFTNRTVCAKVYIANTSKRQIIYEEGGGANGMNLYVYNGKVWFGAYYTSTSLIGNWLSYPVTPGLHWVCGVFSGNTKMELYLDGNLVNSTTIGYTIPSHTDPDELGNLEGGTVMEGKSYCIVGGTGCDIYVDTYELKLNGTIERFLVYNTNLTSTEISDINNDIFPSHDLLLDLRFPYANYTDNLGYTIQIRCGVLDYNITIDAFSGKSYTITCDNTTQTISDSYTPTSEGTFGTWFKLNAVNTSDSRYFGNDSFVADLNPPQITYSFYFRNDYSENLTEIANIKVVDISPSVKCDISITNVTYSNLEFLNNESKNLTYYAYDPHTFTITCTDLLNHQSSKSETINRKIYLGICTNPDSQQKILRLVSYDEDNLNRIAINMSIYYNIDNQGNVSEGSVSYSNASEKEICAYPIPNHDESAELILTYKATNYATRYYYIKYWDLSYKTVSLYLLSYQRAYPITFTVMDQYLNPVPDVEITVKRLIEGAWVTVAQGRTGDDGSTTIPLAKYDTYYQLDIKAADGRFKSYKPQIFSGDSYTLVLDVLKTISILGNIIWNVTEDNESYRIFIYDKSNLLQTVCFKLFALMFGENNTIKYECYAYPSGGLTYVLNKSEIPYAMAYLDVYVEGEPLTEIVVGKIQQLPETQLDLAKWGLMVAVATTDILIGLGVGGIITVLIIISILAFVTLGFGALQGLISGLIILAILIFIKLRK